VSEPCQLLERLIKSQGDTLLDAIRLLDHLYWRLLLRQSFDSDDYGFDNDAVSLTGITSECDAWSKATCAILLACRSSSWLWGTSLLSIPFSIRWTILCEWIIDADLPQ
jgi:hypothetical protein